MASYPRALFDLVVSVAIERILDRAVARWGSEAAAAEALRSGGNEINAFIEGFSSLVVEDLGLGDTDGACFILASLERRKVEVSSFVGTVSELLEATARRSFEELLRGKAIEAAELAASYQFRSAQL